MMNAPLPLCDLHVHSTASDGTVSPEELIDIAREARVGAVALTDHNTVRGLARFEAAARGTDVIAVPGVEITTGWRDKELHILGLFIPAGVRDALADFLGEIDRRKRAANLALVGRLTDAGYAMELQDVLAVAGEATPNRVHVANVLMARGYVASVDEAFRTLLRDGGLYYRAPERLDALEVIAYLRTHGVLPVLAHPLLTLSRDELCTLLPQAQAAGLIGVETLYPLYSREEAAFMAEIATEYGLVPSGGSDFHGANKPDIALGRGRGATTVPMAYYDVLKQVSDRMLTNPKEIFS